jgi:hypothetical protein
MTLALFAADRIDTWIVRFSIAIPLVLLAGLMLWHLGAYLAGTLVKKPRTVRPDPEPPPVPQSTQRLPSDQVPAGVTPSPAGTADAQAARTRHARELLALAREDFSYQRLPSCLDRCQALARTFPDLLEGAAATQLAAQITNDPERLQRACTALVESLAALYLELAASWLRQGQPQQAAAAWQKVVQRCPETRQAQAAHDRLRQLGATEHPS